MGTVRLLQPSDQGQYKTAARICNGDSGARYPGAPARVEDPNFPMENLLISNRYRPWIHPGGGGNFLIDIDLGSNKTISTWGYAALLGTGSTALTLGGVPLLCSMGYKLGTATSPFFGYDGTFTDFSAFGGSITGVTSKRDAGVNFLAAPPSARYIRTTFTIPPATPWSLGTVIIGVGAINNFGDAARQGTGVVYTPGSGEGFNRQRAATRGPGGIPFETETGRQRRYFVYRWADANQSTRDLADAIASGKLGLTPHFLLTPFDAAYEVVARKNDGFFPHLWDMPSQYDVTMELEALP